ncbi:MAG: 2-hydroxychromene-2-carboxylate isomerase [Alphaproteobacteria bacterium]|nr:2-hydroxychromene-2-carboxylate isomerase [Alphaproteobacteria bacterium]
MSKTVECFYSLSSPWAYLGGPRLEEILARRGAQLVLRPFDFLAVAPKTGGIPLRTRPQARQDYHAVELDRWRRFLGLKLNLKPRFYPPADNKPAGHMVIAAQARGLPAQKLSHALLRALWAEERDIADPQVRKAVAEEQGLPGGELLAAESAAETQDEFAANTRAAIARGVFGAPSYVYDDIKYWGQDRLDFLDRALGAVDTRA